MDRNNYARVHRWVSRKLGKAEKCENIDCDGSSKTYHHALKKGCAYEKKIENFICLCAKCHKQYDWRPEFANHRIGVKHTHEAIEKISMANKGKIISDDQKRKLSLRFSGKLNPMYGVSIKGENSWWFGKKHSNDAREKMSKSRSKLDALIVDKIRKDAQDGISQKEISLKYGLSTASISRIVNKKRYK